MDSSYARPRNWVPPKTPTTTFGICNAASILPRPEIEVF
jgi:hypothetical protein